MSQSVRLSWVLALNLTLIAGLVITGLARMLLNQIDALGTQIATLTTRIDELLANLTSTVPDDAILDGGSAPVNTGLDAAKRLAEITGIGPVSAQVVVAEIGLDMSRFPTAAHLVSWTKLSPRTIQSGATQRGGKTGKGNPYLKGALGEAAAVAARTDTFLGERYRRIVKRRGKLKALVAVARSILVIVWNLLARPAAHYQDLGPDYHVRRVDTERRVRSHLAQLTSLGYQVTVEPAA